MTAGTIAENSSNHSLRGQRRTTGSDIGPRKATTFGCRYRPLDRSSRSIPGLWLRMIASGGGWRRQLSHGFSRSGTHSGCGQLEVVRKCGADTASVQSHGATSAIPPVII